MTPSRPLAFSAGRDGNWEIYVMNADGTGLRDLSNAYVNEHSPSWKP